MKLISPLILVIIISLISFGCKKEEPTETEKSIEIVFPKQNEIVEYFSNSIEWSNNTSDSVNLLLYRKRRVIIDTILGKDVHSLAVWLEPETAYNLQIRNSTIFRDLDFNTNKPLEKYERVYPITIEKTYHNSYNKTYMDSLHLSKIDQISYFLKIDKLDLKSGFEYLYSYNDESKIIYGSKCQNIDDPCTILILSPEKNTITLSILNYENGLEYRYKSIIEL